VSVIESCGILFEYILNMDVLLNTYFLFVLISWPTTMWGPAIVMVRVFRPSVCLSHANISETKRDRRVVTRKL